jgi:hypothetical protein
VRDRRKGPPPSRSTATRSPSAERAHRRRGRRRRHDAKPSRHVSGSREMWEKEDGERASRENGEEGGHAGSCAGGAASHPRRAGAPDMGKTTPPPPSGIRKAVGGGEEMRAVFPRSWPRLYTVRFRRGESAPSIWRSTVSSGWRISGPEVAHAGRGAGPIRRPSRRLSDYSPGERVASRSRDAFCCWAKWLAMNSSVSQLVMGVSKAILSKFECFSFEC